MSEKFIIQDNLIEKSVSTISHLWISKGGNPISNLGKQFQNIAFKLTSKKLYVSLVRKIVATHISQSDLSISDKTQFAKSMFHDLATQETYDVVQSNSAEKAHFIWNKLMGNLTTSTTSISNMSTSNMSTSNTSTSNKDFNYKK